MKNKVMSKKYNPIVWLTGESGSGKTSLAKIFIKKYDWIVLDGDEMRESISLGSGFSVKEREEHNYRVSRLAKVLSRQKPVLVTVIAPSEFVRKNISKICDPLFIRIDRTLQEREGYFYEKNFDYYSLDHDKLNLQESFNQLEKYLRSINKLK